eukprot:Platyproteum_vivax@DN4883_c0_g1_i1.p1
MPQNVHTIVLAAGFGNRLTVLSENYPKPLIPLACTPLIYYPVAQLIKHNLDDMTIICQDESTPILQRYFHQEFPDAKIAYFETTGEDGTAMAMKELLAVSKTGLANKHLLVVSCDLFGEVDFTSIVEGHLAFNRYATVVVGKLDDDCWQTPPKDDEFEYREVVHVACKEIRCKNYSITSAVSWQPLYTFYDPANSGLKLSFDMLDGYLDPAMEVTLDTVLDPHIHVYSPQAALVLLDNTMSSLKEDFIPYIVHRHSIPPEAPDEALPESAEYRVTMALRAIHLHHMHSQVIRVNTVKGYKAATAKILKDKVLVPPSRRRTYNVP